MLTTLKPNRCKHCKVRMPEDKARHVLHEECKDAWIAKQLAKQAAARLKKQRAEAKVARAEIKRRKAANMTNGERKAAAQAALNRWIVHVRDAGKPCISCGRMHEGAWHAGHYRSRGSAPHLALDPRNLAKQCAPCNLYLHGNLIGFRAGLIEIHGVAFVEALEADNEPRHYTGADYDDIKAEYRALTNQLRKETP